MAYWLVKEEPGKYSFEQLLQDGKTVWTGVRNYQARNYLREMQPGDLVLYYHTGKKKQIVGIAEVSRPAFPDPTAQEGDWVAVELRAKHKLPAAVPLKEIKQVPALSDMKLVKQARLSVMPVTEEEYETILRMAEEAAAGK
jgi:predicted RNA-binding protein with PUA-like domain